MFKNILKKTYLMFNKVKVVHSIPGRIRLLIPSLDKFPEQMKKHEHYITAIIKVKNGIKSVEYSYLTSKVLIEYDKDIFESVEVKIIRPREHNFYVNTIMDVVPISTKVIGRLGEGITHTLTGVYMILTGANTEGKQMHEFGSSEGILQEQLVLNKAGSPAADDYLIHIDVIIKPEAEFNRELAFSIFELSDVYLQNIREVMKVLSGRDADEVHEFYNKQNPGKPKVALVKEVAGQGMMYDNQLFPIEPSGIDKGISIIDMNNMPVLLTANEYRDGAIRAMV